MVTDFGLVLKAKIRLFKKSDDMGYNDMGYLNPYSVSISGDLDNRSFD